LAHKKQAELINLLLLLNMQFSRSARAS